jgi:hypothetical protein
MMTRIGRERGWGPMTRHAFEALRSPGGALLVGSPEEVVEKLLAQHALFGHQRFLAQTSVGSLPHLQAMRSIELFGTVVAPAVREEVRRRTTPAVPSTGAEAGAPAGRPATMRMPAGVEPPSDADRLEELRTSARGWHGVQLAVLASSGSAGADRG